jgi:hypothetical protein
MVYERNMTLHAKYIALILHGAWRNHRLRAQRKSAKVLRWESHNSYWPLVVWLTGLVTCVAAIKGLPCTVYNRTYENGETFLLDCRTQCACQVRDIRCSQNIWRILSGMWRRVGRKGCGLFNDAFGKRDYRMIGWYLNWKGFGRKQWWYNRGTVTKVAWKDWGK